MTQLNLYYKPDELKRFKIIGWYQIIGGAIGIIVMIWLFAQNISLLRMLSVAIGLGLNGFSIYAGNQLLSYSRLKPTFVIQAIQILNFIGLGITYQVVIGLALGFGFEWFDEAEWVLNFKVLSLYKFSYRSSQTDAIRVVINFIPIIIINYLMKSQEKAQERRHLVEYSADRT